MKIDFLHIVNKNNLKDITDKSKVIKQITPKLTLAHVLQTINFKGMAH